MKAVKRALSAAPILLASVIALSCNNAYGIFQSVQGEKKQVGTSTFAEVPVSKVFRLGSNYYAVVGSLQTTAVGADSWSTVPIGSPTTTRYSLRDAALVGDSTTGTIYALIETGTTHVYSGASRFTVSVYSSTDGATWTAVPLPTQSYSTSLIDNFDALYATSNGQLYAEDHSYDPNSDDPNNAGVSTYTLYHLANGTFDNPVTTFVPAPSSNKTIRGVVFGAGKYWFASEDKLFSGTLPDGSDATDETVASGTFPNLLSTGAIWDISSTGSPVAFVYVTTQNGYVFRSDKTNSVPTNLPLTQVIEVPSANGPTLLVGSDTIAATTVTATTAVGYFEGAWNAFSNGGSSVGYDVAGGNPIYSTTVSTFPVHSFYYDGDATSGSLFICVSPGNSSTTYHGLYVSTWNSAKATWSGWSAQ